jgi:hypothetical protein
MVLRAPLTNLYGGKHGLARGPPRALNQRDAALTTGRLAVSSWALSGWFFPSIRKNVATSNLLQFQGAQMLLYRSWCCISLEDVIACQVGELLASYLL